MSSCSWAWPTYSIGPSQTVSLFERAVSHRRDIQESVSSNTCVTASYKDNLGRAKIKGFDLAAKGVEEFNRCHVFYLPPQPGAWRGADCSRLEFLDDFS